MKEKNPELYSRLLNWKFASANMLTDNEPQDVKDLVDALSKTFLNCGWFEGHMGIIIHNALENIGIKE